MKTHKVKGIGISGHLDGPPDTFTTWCGISDTDNPSEELMENLVSEDEKCTCLRCIWAEMKHIRENDVVYQEWKKRNK